MTSRAELYLPPVPARWARASDLVATLGCVVVRKDRGRWCGSAPQSAQLLRGGRIYYPADVRLHPSAWAHIAHEAVHYHVGKWSLDYEQPMLPFEIELSRRIANVADRRACYRYLEFTGLVDSSYVYGSVDCYVSELIAIAGREWTASPTWSGIREECENKRLPMNGCLRGESGSMP